MAADLDLLRFDFQPKVEEILAACLRDGHHLRPFFTRRNVWVQARLWRQSRSTPEIHRAAAMLEREGAPFLRKVLLEVGPQHGRWATNALPGQSWHQWSAAVDCFVLEKGRAIWSRAHPGYHLYANQARDRGFEAGYFWTRPDTYHVQQLTDSVRSRYTWAQIDAVMRFHFGEEEAKTPW